MGEGNRMSEAVMDMVRRLIARYVTHGTHHGPMAGHSILSKAGMEWISRGRIEGERDKKEWWERKKDKEVVGERYQPRKRE